MTDSAGRTPADTQRQVDPASVGALPDALPDGARTELPTRRQLRLQLRDGKAVAPSSEEVSRPELGEPILGGRRDLRRQYTSQRSTVDRGARDNGGASDDSAGRGPVQGWVPVRPGEMSVAEALAARNATPVEESAQEPAPERILGRPGIVRESPFAPTATGTDEEPAPSPVASTAAENPLGTDPQVVARQRPSADDADVVKPASQVSPPPAPVKHVPMDPASPENLAFLVRLVLMPAPGAAPAAVPVSALSVLPIVLRRREDPEVGADAGADTVVEPSVVVPEASAPVQARTAFGLDPLDVMTAGLRRARRARYIQYSLVGVGAAALVTWIMMIVSSLQG